MAAACFSEHDLKDNERGRANVAMYFGVMRQAFEKLFHKLEDTDGLITLHGSEKIL